MWDGACVGGGQSAMYKQYREEDEENSQVGIEQEKFVQEVRRCVEQIRLQEPVQTQIGLHCQRRLGAVRQSPQKSVQQPQAVC